MKVLNPILSGVAGEYLVAGELSRRGYIASITLRNSKGVDI
ncbi:MAG: aspartate ammonia-lyase, partial [Candidatus Omnitrophica bacterium CG12_big_fil_rev_8_21_14_0_65_42_8]